MLVTCPGCGGIAEVEDEYSTEGSTWHTCLPSKFNMVARHYERCDKCGHIGFKIHPWHKCGAEHIYVVIEEKYRANLKAKEPLMVCQCEDCQVNRGG